jgi:hypothetical protein
MELYYTTTPATPNDRPYDEYDKLLGQIRESFEDAITSNKHLFTTRAEELDLFDIFLRNLPAEARQHYTCNECRRFVNRYGHLVTIGDDGELWPVMWSWAPKFFYKAIAEIRNIIIRSKVTGEFITSDKRLGVAKTGIWHHMAVDIPGTMRHNNRLYTADQVMAQKKEEFKMLVAALNTYKLDTVKTAVNILESESLYRSDKVLGIARWFLKVYQETDALRNEITTKPLYANLIWKKVAEAPAGFCHVHSSMIGTLLDDIEDGYSFEEVKRRFDEKMNPLKYQRPQVAPSAGNVKRAEEIVAKLGIEKSLKRRFARLDEISTIWKPKTDTTIPLTTTGIFSNIKTKQQESKVTNDITPRTQTMTWEKFNRTVLPEAKKIEIHISGNAKENYAAFVTAEDFDAPPIIQWDTEEHRNPVSWYLYNGGSYAYKWNVPGYSYTEITGIALQPNMWQPGYEHQGVGAMFIIKGCKDTSNKSSGLFPEILRNELREVRHTIEAYSQDNRLGGYEEASACGILIQDGFRKPVSLRVTTDVGVRTYILDRWD